MLFRKKMERSCSYCRFGTKLEKKQILCVKQGIVSDSYGCRKFCYDPCKRIPPKPKAMDFCKYDEEDFSL